MNFHTGSYARCWYLTFILVFTLNADLMHTLKAGIDIGYSTDVDFSLA